MLEDLGRRGSKMSGTGEIGFHRTTGSFNVTVELQGRRGFGNARSCLIWMLVLGLTAGLTSSARAEHVDVADKYDRTRTEIVSLSDMTARPGSGASGTYCDDQSPAWDGQTTSNDGRFVAFTSQAPDLHLDDVNGTLSDVFVRDRKKRITHLASPIEIPLPEMEKITGPVDLPGCLKHWSSNPAISGNGRYVAFASRLQLIEDEKYHGKKGTLPFFKVYVRDLKKKTTELISKSWDGTALDGNSGQGGALGGAGTADGLRIDISKDGNTVVFNSMASNIVKDGPGCQDSLVPGVSLLVWCSHVYAHDRRTGETKLVSRAAGGGDPNGPSYNPAVSDDGRFVVFESPANNLTADDFNANCPGVVNDSNWQSLPTCRDIFIHNLRSGETELISVNRDGVAGNDSSYTFHGQGQVVSANGRYVVFGSYATDLVPSNGNITPFNISRIFVRDRKTGRTERVSVNGHGGVLHAAGLEGSITDDGRYVSFLGRPVGAGGPTGPPPSHRGGWHIHDRRTGQTDLIKRTGQWDDGNHSEGDIWNLHFSGNGRYLAWTSKNASYDQRDHNGVYDVFLLDIGHVGTGIGPLTRQQARVRDREDSPIDPAIGTSMTSLGTQLVGASLVHRRELDDLYVKIELERLLIDVSEASVIKPFLYGMRITTDEGVYEIRAVAEEGLLSLNQPVFGLFLCDGGSCREITRLRGAFGTVGDSVIVSVPLHELDWPSRAEVESVQAFTAAGTYLTGAFRVLDTMELL